MLIFIVIGLLAGVLSGILGIGGGIVIVPSLVFFAKMSQKSAVGTSIGAMLLPVGILGAFAYWRDGHMDVKGALLIGIGIFFGAYGGASLARNLSEGTLKKGFAVLLLIVATRMWVTS